MADKHLGVTPVVRRRDGAVRIQLFYRRDPHTPPIAKRQASFKDANDVRHLTEVLGRGQQTVIEGPHASGKMHYWENGGLIEHADAMPVVNIGMVDAFLTELAAESEAMGLEKTKLSLPTASDLAAAVRIDDLMSPHLAKDMDLLAKSIWAIDLDDDRIEYDAFINILRAICAACGGSLNFFHSVVWPWVCERHTVRKGDGPLAREQGVEWYEARWRSFTDSQLGAEYVYGWAATFGFMEGKDDTAKRIFEAGAAAGLVASGEDNQIAAGTDGSATGGSDTAGADRGVQDGIGGGNGPLPFADTHAALADLFMAQFGQNWRYNTD
ncbi:MAG: hypothetical protein JOY83_29385, partial [Alphaproteobacteria bacterium]|nr:hypothetical protein [Alphaproteobacteria bacterium]